MTLSFFKSLLNKFLRLLRKHYLLVTVLLIIYGIFLASGLHEQYPDEYDSLLGGKRILEGSIQYRDWFQHHQPGAYVLSAFILKVTGPHFLRFRLVLESVYFLFFLVTYFYISRRFSVRDSLWYIGFWGLYGILLTFFWGQMLLADTLSAVMLMPAMTILSLLIWKRQTPTKIDVFFINASLFLTWFSSMTFIYSVAILTALTVLLAAKSGSDWKDKFLKAVRTGLFMAIPFLVFFGFFLIIGSLDEWWFANVYYNQNYYIYNYPRPVGTPVNPIRYGVVILDQFIGNYSYALYGILSFPLSSPLNTGLATFMFAYIYVLMTKRQYLYALSLLVTVVFATARNNPNDLRNTDYQSSVYIMLTLFFGFMAITEIRERLNAGKSDALLKATDTLVGLLVAIYLLAVSFFAVNEFRGKMYPKYMGTGPLVYDFPQVAPIINSIVDRNEYAWVGPFEFMENFYMQAKLPSRYHWFLDHAGRISKIQKEMIRDFKSHQPKVIVFRRDYHPWGGRGSEFNGFFTAFLDEQYINTAEINNADPTIKYAWKEQFKGVFNLETEFYLRRNEKDSLLSKLVDLKWIEVKEKREDGNNKKK